MLLTLINLVIFFIIYSSWFWLTVKISANISDLGLPFVELNHMLCFGHYELLIIDEARNIHDIGINLKPIYDEMHMLKVIVTGSSALDLANKTTESLAGRMMITKQLFPIPMEELLLILERRKDSS